MEKFKNRLRTLRKEFKLNQAKLGNCLNYGYTAISNYEAGRNEPSINDLIKLAVIFSIGKQWD